MGKYNSGTKRKQEGSKRDRWDSSGKRYHVGPDGNLTFIAAETDPKAAGNTKPPKRRKGWTYQGLIRSCDFILRDIATVILDACNGPCDETDDGEWMFEVALPFLVARAIAQGKPDEEINTMAWAHLYTRRLACDCPRAWFVEKEEEILRAYGDRNGRPSTLGASADRVSRDFRLSQAKADELGLHSLSGMERPWSVRQRAHKARDAETHKAKREAAGAVPHEKSMSRTKPWDDLGISRATFYRKVDAGEIEADPRMRRAKQPKRQKPKLVYAA